MRWAYETVPIGELVSPVSKCDPRKCETNRPLAYIDIASVDRESKQIEEVSKIYAHEAPSRARQLVKDGDVLVSTVRPNLNAVAQVNYSVDGITASTGFTVLRPKTNKLDSRYLYYWVRSPYFVKDMTRQSTGASYPAVSDSIIKKYFIPLPPLDEQRRIAAILDKADAVRRKRQEAIRLTEELLRSTFLEMFGDPVTNPKGWEVVELGKLLTFLTSGSRGWARFYSTEGDLFLRIQNVRDGKLLLDDIAYVNPPNSAEARRTCVQAGDVLVSITADLGRTAVIPEGLKTAYINQHLAVLRLNKKYVSPIYLASFLASVGGQLQFDRLNREGVKAGLNFDDLKGLQILLPPLEKQQNYKKVFIHQTAISNQYQQGYDNSKNLFNSLLQRAFRGEL